jgi:DNA-binding CsgD family transcriptional regulator
VALDDRWEFDTQVQMSLIETDGRARLVINRDWEIKWANALARALISNSDPIEVVDGSLRFCNRDGGRTLMRVFDDSRGEGEEVAIPIPAKSGVFIARLSSLAMRHYDLLLTIEPVRQKRSFARFDLLFSLTESEYRVALNLLDGRNAVESAKSLSVSVETTRTHIKRIYSKTATNTREGLLSKLSIFEIY